MVTRSYLVPVKVWCTDKFASTYGHAGMHDKTNFPVHLFNEGSVRLTLTDCPTLFEQYCVIIVVPQSQHYIIVMVLSSYRSNNRLGVPLGLELARAMVRVSGQSTVTIMMIS